MMENKLRAFIELLLNSVGLSWYDVYLLKGIRHHDWLYRSKIKIPRKKLVFKPTLENTTEDVVLCERLISAYIKSLKEFSASHDLSATWDKIVKSKFSKLIFDLEREDPAALSMTLANMFQSDFVCGIAPGSLYKRKNRFGLRVWSIKMLDDLVSLAEYLSIIRTECSEQGVIGYAFKNDPDDLVAKMEKSLNMSIGFPDVGAPYGLELNNSLITIESLEHIYVAQRINEVIRRCLNNMSAPKILEIGAGFGGTAFWLLRIRDLAVKSYVIIDLPYINVLQGYFLAKNFGAENVSFYGETNRDTDQPVISVMPTFAIQSYRDINLLINQDSMPEMPKNVVEDYVNWARQNISPGGVFYSYNQESYTPVNAVPQVLVPEVVTRVGGLRRVSRNYSWLHRGYVEEVYHNLEND